MNTIDKLTEYFEKFPGIGPRQAKRFVYFLLKRDVRFIEEITNLLLELKKGVSTCQLCFRFFTTQKNASHLCSLCADTERDKTTLILVEKDVDVENIEKSDTYKGYYFVLGNLIPVLEKEPDKYIRGNDLTKRIIDAYKNKDDIKEIVFALSNNPAGDNTAYYLTELLTPLSEKFGFKLSTLGRGLSTGVELEYSDSDTIRNAFRNRK